MRFSQIERRRKRYVPRQCVADVGMHKDSPMSEIVSLGQAAAKVMRGLTESQQRARAGKLTGSRVACLMTGDAAKIYQMWLEMTGQAQEPDLSDVWPVQLGLTTESLNLDWAERKLGEAVCARGAFINHKRLEWAGITLDGMLSETSRVIECKHCGGREPMETIVDRYQPQMQWAMECTETEEIAFSVIFGANEPVIEFIPRNKEYADEMVRRGAQFMQHVRNRTSPVELPPVPPPVITVKSYDMGLSNQWVFRAKDWLDTRTAAKTFKDAEKSLKEMVPADAKNAHGSGVIIKRDRAGRLSINAFQANGGIS